MLDSRGPPTEYREEEACREEATEAEVKRLMHQTRLWRVANSAQWVAWGIVQAKVPGMNEALANPTGHGSPTSEDAISTHDEGSLTRRGSESKSLTLDTTLAKQSSPNQSVEGVAIVNLDEQSNAQNKTEEEEEFDYLAYAQERAMFFWGDVLQLGIVRREDLPVGLLEKAKIVEY